MLLKVLGGASEDNPSELVQLNAGRRAEDALLRLDVAVEDLLELLVDLKRDFAKLVVLEVILVANYPDSKQALTLVEIVVGGRRLPPQLNQSLFSSPQVFYLFLTYILKEDFSCILSCLSLIFALPWLIIDNLDDTTIALLIMSTSSVVTLVIVIDSHYIIETQNNILVVINGNIVVLLLDVTILFADFYQLQVVRNLPFMILTFIYRISYIC